jgi:chromatin assembly factor 1 subunit B
MIFIWKLSDPTVDSQKIKLHEEDEIENKETWVVANGLRGHLTDVYDLSWSPDGHFLLSGSTDNTSIVWDVGRAKILFHLKDHSHYVQGVSWDPTGIFFATQSCDRTVVIYSTAHLKKTDSTIPFFGKIIKIDHEGTSRKIFEDERINS